MAYPNPSSAIGTLFLSANSGRSSFTCQEPNYNSVPPIICKQTDKHKLLIAVLSNTSGVWFISGCASGATTFHGLSYGTIQLIMRPRE